jgi:hypothetical protein
MMLDRFALALVVGFLAQDTRLMGPPPSIPTVLEIRVDADAHDFHAAGATMAAASPDVYRAVGNLYLLVRAGMADKLPPLKSRANAANGRIIASFGDYYEVEADSPEGAVGHLVIEHGFAYGIVTAATRAGSQRLRLVYPQGSPLNAVTPTAVNLPIMQIIEGE